jgi:hypothetical protein
MYSRYVYCGISVTSQFHKTEPYREKVMTCVEQLSALKSCDSESLNVQPRRQYRNKYYHNLGCFDVIYIIF